MRAPRMQLAAARSARVLYTAGQMNRFTALSTRFAVVPLALACTLVGVACYAPDASHVDLEQEVAQTTQPLGTAPWPTDGKMLALGRAHACSLDEKISGVLCWGDNRRGQARVPLLVGPEYVAAGGDVTCAIASGLVRCWGDGRYGQTRVPFFLGQTTQVAVGDRHVCALTRAGRVRCWGDNDLTQGNVPTLSTVRSLAAGTAHTCALLDDGVTCWGDGSAGQLAVPSLSAPTALALAGDHSCAIDGGDVVCWGGDSDALQATKPMLDAPSALATGAHHVCAIDQSGVVCWGDGATDLTPRELTFPQQIAVGGDDSEGFACARHLQGVACWGADGRGQTRYDGAPLHLLYRSEVEIDAPPEFVWDVILDLDSYPDWNPYTIAMESTLQVGDPMNMTVVMNPLLTIEQVENIRVIEQGKACWGIDTDSPAANSGERCQWVEALPEGRTRYITEDLIEGTLNPLVLLLFGNAVGDGFDSVARALKVRAEALYAAQP